MKERRLGEGEREGKRRGKMNYGKEKEERGEGKIGRGRRGKRRKGKVGREETRKGGMEEGGKGRKGGRDKGRKDVKNLGMKENCNFSELEERKAVLLYLGQSCL